MKINREEFLNDLEMVKSGLSPREFIEQSSCFVFQDGMVMTFNDEVACRKKIGVNITGAIQATSLLAILEKIEDPDLRVRENEKGELEFRGKRKSFGVTKDAEVFLPIDRVEVPEKWRKLPDEFSEAIDLVRPCASTDETKFILTCIHLAPNFIEACDNKQLMRVEISIGLKNSVLVRGAALHDIIALGMSSISMTKSWVHFKNEAGLIFSCRKYMEEYPSLDKIMDFKGRPIVIPRGLAEASDRASIFASDKTTGDPLVIVSLSSGVIRLKGEGLTGWYEEKKKVNYEGPSLEFLIDPLLLRQISEKYSDASISATKLKATGAHWQYITNLVAPKDEEQEEKEEEEAE